MPDHGDGTDDDWQLKFMHDNEFRWFLRGDEARGWVVCKANERGKLVSVRWSVNYGRPEMTNIMVTRSGVHETLVGAMLEVERTIRQMILLKPKA